MTFFFNPKIINLFYVLSFVSLDLSSNDISIVTDAEKEKVQGMFARMMEKYPEWKGPIAPEESARRILKVVRESKVEQSGQFLSYWGNTTEWL